MFTLKLNKNSWHYKVARYFGYRSWNYDQPDFCSYLRYLIFGSIMSTIIILGLGILGAFYLFCVGSAIWWFINGFMYGFKEETGPAVIGVIFISFTLIGLTAISFVRGWIRFPSVNINLPACASIPYCEDTKRLIVAAYHTVHDKTCFKLQFYEGNQNGTDQDTGNTNTKQT